uniref:S-adenosylmethionine synthetase C-terminal domain-containing protein n=2 Tax=Emiliania huxleyi TaxID=2903 RepID=A0A6U8KN98_EMIHU
MAKSVVKSGLAKRACVQLSYAIGVAKPLSLFVETYGTEQGELTAAAITDLVKLYFDCRPGALARDLTLRQPKYNVTAAYCHFGREPYAEGDLKFFSWEDAKDLSKYAGMKAADIATEVEGKKAEILTKWVD